MKLKLTPQVLQKLENRFGKQIRYSKDCEALSRSIEHACKERVSATTLKRMLGFAKSIDKPRLYTLDVLAMYIGYTNWSSLLADTESTGSTVTGKFTLPAKAADADIYLLQHQLVISLTTQTINIKKIRELCESHGRSAEISPFIIELINIAARTRNTQFLSQVFTLPYVFDEQYHDQGQIYYIGQAVGLVLRSYPELAYELLDKYASNPRACSFLIEWFVDEDYLTGYYGELLDKYHEYKRSKVSDKLFYYALKYTQCVQSGDVLQQRTWYNKIKRLRIGPVLHPIVAGRYLGILLSEEPDHAFKTSSSYYKFASHYIIHDKFENTLAFLLYLYRYLFKSQRTDWIIGIMQVHEKNMLKRTEKQKSHWGVKSENQLFIYLAYAHYLNGDSRKAREYIRKTDTNLFESFMYKQIHNDYSGICQMALR